MSSSSPANTRIIIDLNALTQNWRDLDARSRPGKAAAVVKANAYGLGVGHVVPALVEAGCETFFVAHQQEGIAVKALAPKSTIFILNGIHTGNVEMTAQNGLVPVLSDMAQIKLWRSYARTLPCAIQIDTGMNRLGLTPEEAISLAQDDDLNIIHVMSHFACADTPGHPLNKQQIESFQPVMQAFAGVDSSISNSAAILWGGALGHTLSRPGIALYGGEALSDAPNPMRPVIKLEGRIVHVRHAKAGETVSYGATQTLECDTKIATVSVGYADGYPRSASGAGVPLRDTVKQGAYGFVGGKQVPLLGRVTMDLTMFDVTDVSDAELNEGWIELIGPNVPLDDLARAAGTIGYEILTSLGQRYERIILPVEAS